VASALRIISCQFRDFSELSALQRCDGCMLRDGRVILVVSQLFGVRVVATIRTDIAYHTVVLVEQLGP